MPKSEDCSSVKMISFESLDELAEYVSKLERVALAAKLEHNRVFNDSIDDCEGQWVAVPCEDFKALRTAREQLLLFIKSQGGS